MNEVFLGIFEGGILDGCNFEFPRSYGDEPGEGWPLPKFIPLKGATDVPGRYVKYWESSGMPKNKDSARGAKYKWDEHSVGYDLV